MICTRKYLKICVFDALPVQVGLNDYLSAYGVDPNIKTPAMDKLASQGMVFTNAYCNGAWCAPSRVSLLNGFYPHTTNTYRGQTIRQNPVFREVKNIFQHFRQHGYQTFGTGKIFHNGHEEDVWTAFGEETDYGPWPVKDGKIIMHPDMPQKFRDMVKVSPQFFSTSPIVPSSHIDGWYYSTNPHSIEHATMFKAANENKIDLLPDEKSADFAIDILKRSHTQPFFLAVGLVRPHTPNYVPKKYFDMFPPEKIMLPEILENDLDDVVSDLQYQEGTTAFGRQLSLILEGFGGEIGWRKMMQAYLASIAFADDQIARVMTALENSPYANNTIVVLTSDHGYHTGQKNLWFKQTLWDRGTRVPYFIHAPGFAPGVCAQPVSLIDIYPTLNDLAGLPVQPNGIHGPNIEGHSLKPLLLHPDGSWEGPKVALTSTTNDALFGINFTVRSENYRYILTRSGQEELYDLLQDPNEWSNLADKPEYGNIKQELRNQLTSLVAFQ
ncbi:MAG: sulfatase [Cyclobacteriaceae bacterium]|nr:sulfatase [Cyclobacteriaceae bacterium]